MKKRGEVSGYLREGFVEGQQLALQHSARVKLGEEG